MNPAKHSKTSTFKTRDNLDIKLVWCFIWPIKNVACSFTQIQVLIVFFSLSALVLECAP